MDLKHIREQVEILHEHLAGELVDEAFLRLHAQQLLYYVETQGEEATTLTTEGVPLSAVVNLHQGAPQHTGT